MGFFDALRRVLHRDAGGPAGGDLAAAWGLSEGGADAGPTRPADLEADATAYDRAQWQKKMKRILDELPGSQSQWAELMSEARALNLDPAWVTRCQVDEFMLLIRRAVSDRHFTEAEHRKLDLARDLIGIPEAEAEAALNSIIAEAESFFGGSVEGT
jgi:hypothetical protein